MRTDEDGLVALQRAIESGRVTSVSYDELRMMLERVNPRPETAVMQAMETLRGGSSIRLPVSSSACRK